MSTYLYPAGAATVPTRTNLHPDPRFIGTDSIFISGAGAVTQEDVGSGAPDGRGYTAFTVTTTIGSRLDVGTGVEDRIPVTPGDTYAASAYANWSAAGGSTAPSVQMVFVWYDAAGGVVGQSDGPIEPAIGGSQGWSRPALVAQAPAGSASGQPRVRSIAGAGGIIAGVRLRVAQRLCELDWWVNAYFDGGTEPRDLYTYGWTGAENASPSVQLEPDYYVQPDLVLNYEHEQPSPNVAFDTVTGGLVVATRYGQPARSGTFQFFARDQYTARQIQDVCARGGDVVLVTDDPNPNVPDAPLTFTPVDRVRMTWNTPYESWTVSVPYRAQVSL